MCYNTVVKIWKPLDILLRECRGFVEWPSWSRSCWLLLRRPPGIIFVHQLYIVSFFSLAKIHCCRLKKFGGKRGTLFSRKNLVSRTPYYRARICWWRHDTFNPRASTVEPSPLGKKAKWKNQRHCHKWKVFVYVRIFRVTQVTKALSFSL